MVKKKGGVLVWAIGLLLITSASLMLVTLMKRPGAELFLVIGQDQYAGLASWRDWEALLDAVTLAVAARAGQPVAPPPALAARPHRVLPLQMPPVAASSTAIRAHLEAGHPADDLVPGIVPGAVARYIESHHLYRQPPPPPRS